MPRETSLRKAVEVLRSPAELVNQRPERERRVHTSSGNHHVRPSPERGSDWTSAKIGIEAQRFGDQRRPDTHLRDPKRAELVDAIHQVVTLDPGDSYRRPCSLGHGTERIGRGLRVHSTGIRHDTHLLLDEPRQVTPDHSDHVGRIPKCRILFPRPRKNPHRDLGKRLEEDVVTSPGVEQLRRSKRAVAPCTGRATDHNRSRSARLHDSFSPCRPDASRLGGLCRV